MPEALELLCPLLHAAYRCSFPLYLHMRMEPSAIEFRTVKSNDEMLDTVIAYIVNLAVLN